MTDNLPPLPTPARITSVQFCDDGLWFTAEQMQYYARAAIEASRAAVPAGWVPTDARVTFDTWLRSVCIQAPPDHAQDLARSAWIEADKQASADCEAMAEEIERLQKALAFWMPDVPPADHPLYKRVANDVYLLVGCDGPNPEPSAFELGHVALAESQPTLWAIHVPGPDDYYPAPSEEAANHMASKHNAAMAEWNKSNPDTSGNRPPIESSMASAQRWPGSAADHAEEIAVFDYAAWGLASPQPQPVQPSEVVEANQSNPTNNYLFKLMCARAGIVLGVDRVDSACEKIDRMFAQAKPEQAAQQWQPIETAPKNGTSLLLKAPSGRIADGAFDLRYRVWAWPYVMVEPTHWLQIAAIYKCHQPIREDELVTMYDEAPTSDAEMIEFARAVERYHGITAPPKPKD